MRRKKKNMACSSFHVTYNEQETGCVLIPTGASSFYPRIVHAECQLIPLKQEMAMYRLGVRESFSVCLTLTLTHAHTHMHARTHAYTHTHNVRKASKWHSGPEG